MLTLDNLTVGHVSGMIAAAIAIVHIFIILAIPLIVVAIFNTKKNPNSTASAVTWTVVGRSLNSSWWPFIVQADSASTRGVPSYIVFTNRFKTVLILLASISAIITPLGLYESISPNSKAAQPSFTYLADPSDFGSGTISRSHLEFSRICGAWVPVACPNSFSNVTTIINDTGDYAEVYSYDTSVPQYVLNAFESGLATMDKSVSSIFDIQPRAYTYGTINNSPGGYQPDNNKTYPISSYRQISTMVTDNRYLAIEGLIVDMVNGGIGFRNHSGPPATPFGSIWSEDILFIEPESACVDLNLTMDFMLPLYTSQSSGSSLVANLVLTDHGGFVNLNQTFPTWDSWVDRQNQPDLEFRAYRAAWLNNAYSMAFMNITNPRNDSDPNSKPFSYLNSELGKTFSLMNGNEIGISSTISPNQLTTSGLFGNYLQGLDSADNFTIQSEPPLYPNPFGINFTMWDDVEISCKGAGGNDFANITNVAALCGLMYGAPRRRDNGNDLLFSPGSNWSIPLYSCISTSKAIIKSVSFQFNGSNSLAGLNITDIQDKVYADNASKPLWGVEQTEHTLANVLPLWGLVSSPTQGNISLSTLRKEFLYLPGYASTTNYFEGVGYQNLPGVSFHTSAMGVGFNIGSENPDLTDYSGFTNLAMFRKWQELSQSAANASHILNLVWTDSAANAVVGTKTLQFPDQQALQKRGNSADIKSTTNVALPYVITYNRRVHYEVLYGIPAFLTLFLTITMLAVTLIAILLGRTGPLQMRRLLNKASQGRILTSRIYKPGQQPHHAESAGSRQAVISGVLTRQWAKSEGSAPITVIEEDSQTTEYHPLSQTS